MFIPKPAGLWEIKETHPQLRGMKTDYVTTEDDVRIALWNKIKTPPDKTRPVYVVFHGHTGHWTDTGDPSNPTEAKDPDWEKKRQYRIGLLKAIDKEDADFVAVHLRGYGLSEGAPSQEGFEKDVDAVIQWLKEKKIPADRVVVLGESLGGAMAAMMAKRMTELKKPPAVVGLVAAFSSMAERARDQFPAFTVEELKEKIAHPFNNAETLQAVSPSTMIYLGHAPDDNKTFYDHSERMHKAVKEVPARKRNRKSVYLMPLSGGHTGWDSRKIIEDTMQLYRKYHDGVTLLPNRP